MKTEVAMNRTLFGKSIRQSSKDEFLSATDAVNAGNKWRLSKDMPEFNLQMWLKNKDTVEFISELRDRLLIEPVKVRRGKLGGTWMHPLLFIDMALAIHPKLKFEVYTWLYDELIKARNNSGDSYRRMCGGLFSIVPNKQKFPHAITKIADFIRVQCGVEDWQHATEEQLKLRDTIHDNIALFTTVLTDPLQCVKLGVLEAKKIFDKR